LHGLIAVIFFVVPLALCPRPFDSWSRQLTAGKTAVPLG
jgi:hypothetical protein